MRAWDALDYVGEYETLFFKASLSLPQGIQFTLSTKRPLKHRTFYAHIKGK